MRTVVLSVVAMLVISSCSWTPSSGDRAAEPTTPTTSEAPPAADAVATVEVEGETEVREAPATEVQGVSSAAIVEQYEIVNVPVGLNLRSGPGVGFDVVLGIPKDRVVVALGEEQDGWMKVAIDGETGWVASSYLQPTDREDPGPATAVPQTAGDAAEEITVGVTSPQRLLVVDVDTGLNLRSGPGVEQTVVGSALLGDAVQSTGRFVDDWMEITAGGVTGWAASAYLQPID